MLVQQGPAGRCRSRTPCGTTRSGRPWSGRARTAADAPAAAIDEGPRGQVVRRPSASACSTAPPIEGHGRSSARITAGSGHLGQVGHEGEGDRTEEQDQRWARTTGAMRRSHPLRPVGIDAGPGPRGSDGETADRWPQPARSGRVWPAGSLIDRRSGRVIEGSGAVAVARAGSARGGVGEVVGRLRRRGRSGGGRADRWSRVSWSVEVPVVGVAGGRRC